MSTHGPQSQPWPVNPNHRIAIIAARFNEHVVGKLLSGCQSRLRDLGVADGQVSVFRVPGAFELPVAARVALTPEDGNPGFDAAICLGCIIRGETYHFDTVANETAAGVREVSVVLGKPTIFGVLTVENQAQADARTGGGHGHAGVSAAEAAVEMLATLDAIRSARVGG